MGLLIFLILFPLAAALMLFLLKDGRIRNAVVTITAFGVLGGCVALFATNYHQDIRYFRADFRVVDKGMLWLELIMAGYILYMGVKHKRLWTPILIFTQMAMMAYFEVFLRPSVASEYNLFVDKLSMIMTLVVGIMGGLTCLYSIGYMKDFHQDFRKEVTDERRLFFFLVCVFLSAMFGIIFSNNLLWIYFFWEITTLCSFRLIAYKKTKEAWHNAFRALEFNLLGSLAFSAAIVYLYFSWRIIELDKIFIVGKAGVLVPVIFLCIAGMAKSAQLPFSSWLLGAMVAPTPVSALLHSSTMVKAGVYIIIRMASILEGTLAGFVLALIGAVTFLIASFIALSQSDAKKVLAYSTVGNLGLIVLCAGVGTYEALWAAILLVIFHAVAKCLLFLCVGMVEHKIRSRSIEDMAGLIISMPKTAIMMQIGMAGMFLAPFGMLISKWAALKALVDYNPLLAIFVVFGSSATLFFWVKWLGKIITVISPHREIEDGIGVTQWASLIALSAITIGVCGLFPVISAVLIQPYVMEIYDKTIAMSRGNIVIMSIMLAMVTLFPLSFITYGKRVRVVDAFLSGANVDSSTQFRGSRGEVKHVAMQNFYMKNYFAEGELSRFGSAVCIVLTIIMIGLSIFI